jgi:hypothetical protein
MNRKVASLLFFAAAVLSGGCSDHPDSFGDSGSSGSTGSTGGSVIPTNTDLAAFARAGIADPESAEARAVNDVSFVSDENPDAFNDVF